MLHVLILAWFRTSGNWVCSLSYPILIRLHLHGRTSASSYCMWASKGRGKTFKNSCENRQKCQTQRQTCRHCHSGWSCWHQNQVYTSMLAAAGLSRLLRPILVTEMQQQTCLGLSVEHRTNMHKRVVEAQHLSVPIEAHGCCSALCLLWLRLWAAWAHGILLPKWWDGLPKLSSVYTTAASREAAAAPSAAGAETDRTKVLGGAAFGAADARPRSSSLGPSNPREAFADAVDAQPQHSHSCRTSSAFFSYIQLL